MLKNKDNSNKTPLTDMYQYLKKNLSTIVMTVVLVIVLVSPDAKSFVIRQLMVTGLFNASIEKKDATKVSSGTTDFDFADETGYVQNTSSLRGKVVFINFWASWCPPCRAEFPSIEKLYLKFKDNPNVVFLSINEDDQLSIGRKYLDKEKFTFPMHQSRGSVPAEIYSGTLPTTVVWDKKGHIKYHHTGFANYASEKFVKQMEELIDE